MKKKKINKNENEWKGILQEKEPFTIIENYDIPNRIKKELREDKGSTYFYQTGESNVSTESVTSTNGSDYDVDKLIFEAKKEPITYINSISYSKEDLIKRWKEAAKFIPVNKDVCDKRIDFEFTPFTFWQLFPSVAINLHSKEIELTWLCFGMYIKYKMK